MYRSPMDLAMGIETMDEDWERVYVPVPGASDEEFEIPNELLEYVEAEHNWEEEVDSIFFGGEYDQPWFDEVKSHLDWAKKNGCLSALPVSREFLASYEQAISEHRERAYKVLFPNK